MSPNKRKSASENAEPEVRETVPEPALTPADASTRPNETEARGAGGSGSLRAAEHHAYERRLSPHLDHLALRNEPRIDALQGDFFSPGWLMR